MATAISPPAPSMSSSSISEPHSPRGVRFDDECVLIPEFQRKKRPMIITKTYSLPLWKRRATDDDQTEEQQSPVFKVPIPNFKSKTAKTTRSSSHGRDPTSPLSPCLVHRSSTVDGLPPQRKLERRPSLPLSPNLGKPHSTVPLRSCCPDCVTITEECLKEGAAWVEKFTRGARRRRNSGTNSDSGFAPVSLHQAHSDAAVVRLGTSVSINVDEVDKRRRRSRDFAVNDPPPHTAPSPPLVSSAIIEEDEDQLFPLPSPRRSPNSSPANSAAASPNASTSQLASSESSKVPEEGILAKSLGRRGRCENGLLMPDAEAGTTLATTTTVQVPPVEHLDIASSSTTFVESPPSSPVSSRSKSHSRSPERRRQPKERRPSFGSSVLRATGDMLKGVNLGPMPSGGISV